MTSSRRCPHLGMQTGDLGLPQNSLWIQQLQTIGWVIERPLVHHAQCVLQHLAMPFRDREEGEGKSPRVLGEVLCTEEPVGPEGAEGLVWNLWKPLGR